MLRLAYIHSPSGGPSPGRRYWQPARHPRAGLALGIAILAAWLGGIGIAVTSDDDTGARHDSPPATHVQPAKR